MTPAAQTRGLPASGSAARGIFVFITLSALQRLSGLLVLPLVSRAMTPSEYGKVAIVVAFFTLASVVLGLGLEAAVFRVHFTEDGSRRDSATYTLAVVATAAPITLAALPAAALVIAQRDIWGVPSPVLAVSLIAAALTAPLTTYGHASLRSRERYGRFAVVVGAGLAVSVTARLVLVVVVDGGLWGWVLADLLTAGYAVSVTWSLLRPARAPISREVLTWAARFSLPLIPHMLAFSLLVQGDRIVMAGLVDDADIARYSVTYQVIGAFSLVALEVTRAFMPSYARSLRDGSALRPLVHLHVATSIVLAASAVLVAPLAIRVIVPEDFRAPGVLVPWLAVSVLALGIYGVFMAMLTLVAGRTRTVWAATVTSASLSLGLTAVLVQVEGIVGAAQATALGYLCLVLLVGTLAQRCQPQTLPLMVHAGAQPLVLTAAVVFALCSGAAMSDEAWSTAAAAVGAVVLLPCVLVLARRLLSLDSESRPRALVPTRTS